MPVQISVHPDRQLAYFRFSGVIDTATGAAAFRDYLRDPSFDPSYVMLSDTQAISRIDAGFASILSAALRLAADLRRFEDGSLSVICAPDDTVFGVGRMMQQTVEPISRLRFRIVETEQEALRLARQPEPGFAELVAALARDKP